MDFSSIDNLRPGRTRRESSWDRTGGNADYLVIPSGETKVIADIQGPGRITHLWMTAGGNYRNLLIKITWDNAPAPSVFVPYGDFFGQGNCYVNSYQSLFFSSSTDSNNRQGALTALNCYLPMPFKERALVVLVNESDRDQGQYFYIDYELYEDISALGPDPAYLHAEFRRQAPFGGWGPEIKVNTPETDGIPNLERDAWDNNYIIMETRGRGHYLGCFFSVVNMASRGFESYANPDYWWWGEGDDMIWVDGYKWPPDLHGTGSEDYFNQALGMQRNAFLRNGTAVHEFDTGGASTSYIFHLENPVRFQKEIKVTIEIGHANHLGNDISSVAFWYAAEPASVLPPPPVAQRQPPVKRDGQWILDPATRFTTHQVPLSDEKRDAKREWRRQQLTPCFRKVVGEVWGHPKEGYSFKITSGFGQGVVVPLEEVIEDLLDGIPPTDRRYVRYDLFGTIIYLPRDASTGEILSKIEEERREIPPQPLKITCGVVLDEEWDEDHPAEISVGLSHKLTRRD